MNQEQARAMLVRICEELLAKEPGTTRYSFAEMAGMMRRRYCANHLARFVSAFVSEPCACGQALCPSSLTRAVQTCFINAARAYEHATRTVH